VKTVTSSHQATMRLHYSVVISFVAAVDTAVTLVELHVAQLQLDYCIYLHIR